MARYIKYIDLSGHGSFVPLRAAYAEICRGNFRECLVLSILEMLTNERVTELLGHRLGEAGQPSEEELGSINPDSMFIEMPYSRWMFLSCNNLSPEDVVKTLVGLSSKGFVTCARAGKTIWCRLERNIIQEAVSSLPRAYTSLSLASIFNGVGEAEKFEEWFSNTLEKEFYNKKGEVAL